MPAISHSTFNSTQSADGLSATELLDTNWQTTAAVGLTVATGGVTGALMLAAFPAQTIAASATIGGLAYAGKRRADGKSALPFVDRKPAKAATSEEPVKADEDTDVGAAAVAA